jgi:hypothetical protein
MATEQADKSPRDLRRHEWSAGIRWIDWDELVDGKLRRFKRGKHYVGLSEALVRQAKLAAADRHKRAVTFKDQIGKYEYVWVQFLDGKIEEGDPCPRCEATSLERWEEYFARCPSCGAVLALSAPAKALGPDPDDVAEVVDARLLSTRGEEIQELSVQDEAVMEATCRFHRGVLSAQPHFTVLKGRMKALRTGFPDAIRVAEPEILRFSVRLAPRVLAPGDYRVTPSVEMLVEDEEQQRWPLKIDKSYAFKFRLVEPADCGSESPADKERSPLHWTVTMASSDEPPPVAGFDPRSRQHRRRPSSSSSDEADSQLEVD